MFRAKYPGNGCALHGFTGLKDGPKSQSSQSSQDPVGTAPSIRDRHLHAL